MRGFSFTEAEKAEIWERRSQGESMMSVARHINKANVTVWNYVAALGGFRPRPPRRSKRELSVFEREEISRGLADGRSCRAIAASIGRPPCTVSREVARNLGHERYRAQEAERRCQLQRKRPKAEKLVTLPRLRDEVTRCLEQKWSPEQTANWLKLAFPDDLEMRVSHETIYRSLFIQGRGVLKRELCSQLRTHRRTRMARGTRKSEHRGQIKDKILISERPAEVSDRAVPGHWEGDLLLGTKYDAIGTLVERTSRFVMLFPIPDSPFKASSFRSAITPAVTGMPEQLKRSLTWDQGPEMAEHVQFTIDTGLQVYFCDPRSPWQRGSNENTNGLLRQYFPSGKTVKDISKQELDEVANQLNARPRETLGWLTPAQKLAEVLR